MINAIKPLASSQDWLLVTAEFANLNADALYKHFTQADLLAKWWAPSAPMLDLTIGGHYHLEWQPMNWHLRGTYKAVEPGKVLAYTWKWDHEPELPMRNVCIMFQEGKHDGASLTLLHGTYGDNEAEQQDRQSHLDGWVHFLGQLQKV
jgi:uncharacterized protein YndB with AHSA1/START domain